ncbi:MAG: hypothetical protein ACTHMR_17245 [Thermomicrobiales bacterium]|jgi:hypothetical protein
MRQSSRDKNAPTTITSRDRLEEAPAGSTSEFICQGCGKPLHLTLHSDMCYAEALVFCPDCERDYQERRGRWAPETTR